MEYVNFHGGFIIRYGFFTRGCAVADASDLWWRWDPIVHVVHGTSRDIGYLPVEYTLRKYLDRGEPTHQRFSLSKPLAVPYDSALDFAWYGSYLSSLAATLDLASGGPFKMDPPTHEEHQVHHRNVIGRASSGQVSELFDYNSQESIVRSYATNLGLFPAYHDDWQKPSAIPGVYGSPGVSGFSFQAHLDQQSWYPRRDLLTSLLFFEELYANGWSETYTASGHLFTMGVLDFHVEVSGFDIIARYNHVYEDFTTGYSFLTECVYRNSYDPSVVAPLTHLDPSLGTQYFPVNRWGQGSSSFTRTLVSPLPMPSWLIGVPFGATYTDTTFDTLYLSEAQQLDGTSAPIDLPYQIGKASFPSEFFTSLSKKLPDIRLSSAQSSSSALDDLTSSIGKDNFQTLAKISALADAMPDLSGAARALAKITTDPIVSMKDLVSAASQVKLQSSYQWSPTFSFIVDDLPAMKDLITAMMDDSQGGIVVGRGSYEYQFPPGTFGRDSTSLLTRTKVVAKRSSRSVFSTIVDLRALGLPLGPSTVWDLIPFSFVANWFSGVGARIRDAEAIGSLIGSGTWYYVHSYRIDSKFTADEMGSLGIRAFTPGSEEPTLRFYAREVSKHPPRFRDGEFDFRLPTRPPDWTLVGSLLWQLLV